MPKPIIASLIFKGLPNSFDAIVSRKYKELIKDIANIDIFKLISELISEEARMFNNIDLKANKAIKSNISFYKYYNKKGHIEARCFIKYPKLKKTNYKFKKDNKSPNNYNKIKKNKSSKVIMSAFTVINKEANYKLILDSGASKYYTPIKEWLIDYKVILNKSIIIANGTKVPVIGVGNIPIIIGNKDVLIKDVCYIPSLKTTLISSKELTNKGWNILFKDNIAELSNIKYKLNIKG